MAEAWANQALQDGGPQQDTNEHTCTLTETEAAYLQQVAHAAVFGSQTKL